MQQTFRYRFGIVDQMHVRAQSYKRFNNRSKIPITSNKYCCCHVLVEGMC